MVYDHIEFDHDTYFDVLRPLWTQLFPERHMDTTIYDVDQVEACWGLRLDVETHTSNPEVMVFEVVNPHKYRIAKLKHGI